MEKILVFKTKNSRDYWFKYIIKELKNKCVLFKVYFFSKEIWLNGDRIMFITLKEDTLSFEVGRHNSCYYYDMENGLENNFKRTLKEILLNGKSRD